MPDQEDKNIIIARMVAARERRDSEAEAAREERERAEREAERQRRMVQREWDSARGRIEAVLADTNNLLKAAGVRLRLDKTQKPLSEGLVDAYRIHFGLASPGVYANVGAAFEVVLDGTVRVSIGKTGDQHPLQTFNYAASEIREPEIDEVLTALLKYAEEPG
jgi:hypothetical protein